MSVRRIACVFSVFLLISVAVCADDKVPQGTAASRPLTTETRMNLIRAVTAELVYARHVFPMGVQPLTLKNGTVMPGDEELKALIAMNGTAVKPGDPARITKLEFKKNEIIVEVNGGPRRKTKWYQRIEVGAGSGGNTTPVSPVDPNTLNAHGSAVRILFDKYVPEMSLDEFKALLKPVLNFDARSVVEAYLDTVPPKVKEAIKDHQVLVGMNREMVTYAKGRPPKKVRERDGATEYEEWIYGQPPQDVEFVRFVGEEVTRLEIMKVSGDKIVKTEKEVDLSPKPALAQGDQGQPQGPGQPAQPGDSGPVKKPTLRRPGEAAPPPPPGGPGQPGQNPPTAPPGTPPGQGTGIPPQ